MCIRDSVCSDIDFKYGLNTSGIRDMTTGIIIERKCNLTLSITVMRYQMDNNFWLDNQDNNIMYIMWFLPKGRSYKVCSLHDFLSWASLSISWYGFHRVSIVWTFLRPLFRFPFTRPSSVSTITLRCIYRTQCPNPVSYTHLDVYKRQLPRS